MLPDLRHAKRAVHDRWNDIVLGGIRATDGMASFADVLSQPDSNDIHSYVIERALHEPGIVERLVEWFAENACIPPHWLTD